MQKPAENAAGLWKPKSHLELISKIPTKHRADDHAGSRPVKTFLEQAGIGQC